MRPRWKFPIFYRYYSTSIRSFTVAPNPSHLNSISPIISHVHMSRLLTIYGKQQNLQLGSSLHCLIIKNHFYYNPTNYFDDGIRTAIVVWNSLLSFYSKCLVLEHARKVFDEMPVRDTVSWNSVISGFLSNGDYDIGFKFFKGIVELGVGEIDQATFTTVLSACSGSGFIGVSKMVHGLVVSSGYVGDVTVGNALITSYFNCGCCHFARRVFDEMVDRNVITWTAVISGFAQQGFYEDSLKLFRVMCAEFVDPNALTFLSLLSACSGLQASKVGTQIHGLVLKLGFSCDLCIESALMDMYSKCGNMKDALLIFHSASKLDKVSMTIILVGFAQNGLEEEATQVFVKMVKSGTDIDPNMVSAILGVFGVDTSLAFGQQIHSLAIKRCLTTSPFVNNGLINMYSKCGNLEESTKIFLRMPQRNSISWNSIIAAFARHGDGLKAIQLYEEMLLDGVDPTDVTFLSLLHACSHVGLVDKGMEFLDCMIEVHGINPRMEHYACVVDMLGRAGRLNEAKIFVDQLSIKPGILVWQALLGACAIHGNSDIGKHAADQLIQLEPENPAPYIQLANIYSSEGKWRDRASSIKRIKVGGMTKETGISWIEINKKIHSFVVCDRMHPQAESIYNVLEEMFFHLRDEGYKPDKRFILHYLGQDKEENQVDAINS